MKLHEKNSPSRLVNTHFQVFSNTLHLYFSLSFPLFCCIQELQPKGRDVRQDELGDLVDKEMAATSAAIEEAVRRIDVSLTFNVLSHYV